MRTISDSGLFWLEPFGDLVRVGLTEAGVVQLGVIWNIVPNRKKEVFSAGDVVATLETSKKLTTLRMPLPKGRLTEWNDEMLRRPETLTQEQWLFLVKE